jgi:Ca2+-binding RTX toxin-like protein
MPQIRRLAATTAIVAALLLVFTSVASAHPGPHVKRFGPNGFDSLWVGSTGDDTYTAAEGNRDKIIGRAGNDVLDGGDKRDLIRGNRGKDAIVGGPGSDRIAGGPGQDRLAGGAGPDLILGGLGPDGINGGAGHDLIKAGPGADVVVATDGVRDWIFCGRGKDTVTADTVDRVHRSCEDVTRVSASDSE